MVQEQDFLFQTAFACSARKPGSYKPRATCKNGHVLRDGNPFKPTEAKNKIKNISSISGQALWKEPELT